MPVPVDRRTFLRWGATWAGGIVLLGACHAAPLGPRAPPTWGP